MKNLEFDYPIDYDIYSIEEITIIIDFFNTIEQCYLDGVLLEDYKKIYKKYKTVVRTKSEENSMLKDFKKVSGYDGYLTTKEMKNEKTIIRIKV
ncbi:UPF0223 family protein [Gemella sp. GH3]|uniref:UPF0223 family protein n=1 Tax=unclassified Gemella TaxID=2624949 RepID=UPI0015CF9548|nr:MULTISPECIES: UPF0223 family protein [unclassified Gemella]MBF0713513.1 UPF0223 family protein [Gemella sp. GH3.1]NYS50465.1 UPF0223 family protein [Gemella sp. GH3]